MRVTQKLMSESYLFNMNQSLTRLMDLNVQAGSQKRINKPSDDPAGTFRVLDHRHALRGIEQYRRNIDTAKGWLKQGDDAIVQMNTALTRLKTLAEQGSTGTLTGDNREEIAYEVRELFHQLISLANVSYEGKSIFAGHKVDGAAFQEDFWLSANHGELDGMPAGKFSISGGAQKTAIVQFTSTGALGAGTTFRFSTDGGKTFSNGVVGTDANGDFTLAIGTQTLTFDNGAPPVMVTANSATDTNDTTGTWLRVYPTARYLGDDNDAVDVDEMGAAGITGSATGVFPGNVMVRIDQYDDAGDQAEYSFSTDGGLTWDTDNTAPAPDADTQLLLTVPGGSLTLNMPTNIDTDLAAGQQFIIRPRTADIALAVSPSQRVVVNSVGKDVFGGLFTNAATGELEVAMQNDPGQNLFDTVGRLLANLETNTQTSVSKSLEDLRTSSQNILNHLASIAGRENSLDVADAVLEGLKVNETQRLSGVEDADLTELMTRLAQQQISYEAVLKSSSNIMQMSLLNYM